LSDTFPIQNGVKQGDALTPLLFNFASEYVVRKAQENHVGLKLNGTYLLLAFADDVNLFEDNINTSKEGGLELNAEKNEVYIAVSPPECRAKS
jgi:hypothetical protein